MNSPVRTTARAAPGEARVAVRCPATREDGLAEEEGDEAQDHAEDHGQHGGDAELGGEQQRSPRGGGQRGADGAARVLAGDQQGPEDAAGQGDGDHAGQGLPGWDRSPGRTRRRGAGAAWVTSPVTRRQATTVRPSVMAVDRRVTILASSDRAMCFGPVVAPRGVQQDLGGHRRTPRSGGDLAGHRRRAVLHLVLGQLHERVLQGGGHGRQLVDPESVPGGQVADLRARSALRRSAPRRSATTVAPAARQAGGERVHVRGDEPDRPAAAAGDEVGHARSPRSAGPGRSPPAGRR